MQAWAKKLAEEGTKVRFIADDTGAFVTSLGLIFDASALLGAPRSKRFALVAENGTVSVLAVEDSPGDLKVRPSFSPLAPSPTQNRSLLCHLSCSLV
jgi:peroxiredoxin